MKPNDMMCWKCEKKFAFYNEDIVEFTEPEVGECIIDPQVLCPHCKTKQTADYDFFD